MTATQPSVPSSPAQSAPERLPVTSRVPVATTIVLFTIVMALLAFIAFLAPHAEP